MNKALENLQSLTESINTMQELQDVVATKKQALQDVINSKTMDMTLLAKSIEMQQAEFSKSTLDRKQICERLGITEPTLIKRRNAGLIPYVKLGNKFYYLNPGSKGGQNG